MNYDEQKRYVDFAADMGYESVLVDAWWDSRVGYERTAELARYAAGKGSACICGTIPTVIGTMRPKGRVAAWTT